MHRLTPSEATAEIATLINSRPAIPRVDEIEAIIAKALATPAATPARSSEHLAYRKIVAEIERYNDPDMPYDDEETDAALSRLQEQACELETEIWARPATLADVLLRAEIALCNENGVMDALDDPDAYHMRPRPLGKPIDRDQQKAMGRAHWHLEKGVRDALTLLELASERVSYACPDDASYR